MKTDSPKVSIITPSYNQAQFIERTILSVLNQDYPNIEYIIIDGGSTDGSVDIIRKYEHRMAYWVSEPDRGQTHAINKGFQRATGEIIAYLNSDDLYKQCTISSIVECFKKDPEIAMISGDCEFIDENNNVVYPNRAAHFDLEKLLFDHYIPQPATFFKKKTIEDVGFLDESLHYLMDYDLFLRIGLKSGKIQYLPLTLAQLRIHSNSKSESQSEYFCPEVFKILDKFFLCEAVPKSLSDIKVRVYSERLQRISRYQQKWQMKNAIKCLQRFDSNLISDEEFQSLYFFFEGNALTQEKIENAIDNLSKLYRAFYTRHICLNGKAWNIRWTTNSWITLLTILLVHNLLEEEKRAEAKFLLRALFIIKPVLIMMIPLKILLKPSAFKSTIKYMLCLKK